MPPVGQGVGIGGPQRDRLVISRHGFFEPLHLVQRVGAVIMDFGQSRHKSDCPVIAGHRLVEPAEMFEGDATVIVRLGVVGQKPDSRVAAGQRIVIALESDQRGGAVRMGLGIVGLQRNRPTIGFNGKIELAGAGTGGACNIVKVGDRRIEIDQQSDMVERLTQAALLIEREDGVESLVICLWILWGRE